MTYQGYMALSNDSGDILELVNAARVKAYTDNLAPSIGLRGCDDCDGLPAALGQSYDTPEADNAPWYDPTDPDTAGFYGVYPLSFEGVDDSTRAVESAELTGDGSVVVGSRFAGQEIRVTGMAFARDEAALYAGVSWLNSALNGTEEGRCFGDRLNVFSSCPPVEVLPPGFATPWTLVNTADAQEIAQWTTTSGTIVPFPDELRFNWVTGDPRKVACREVTGLLPGQQYQLRISLRNFGSYFVSMGRACAERQVNLIQDPRLTSLTMTTGGGSMADSRPNSGGPDGGSYFRREVVADNSSDMEMPLFESESFFGVEEGADYSLSYYARKSIPGGSDVRLEWRWFDGNGDPLSVDQGALNDPPFTWTQYEETISAPVGAAYLLPVLVWEGQAFISQRLDLAQVMMNIGSSVVDYFDGGYPGARWLDRTNDSRSVLAKNVDAEIVSDWTYVTPEGAGVLDFVARSETMYLSIQPTNFTTLVPTDTLEIAAAEIRRIERPAVVAEGSGYNVVPPSDGWTHVAPAGMLVEWGFGQDFEFGAVRASARTSFEESATYDIEHGVERTLYGLRPGSRYRLTIEFAAQWAETDSDPYQALSVFAEVSGWEAATADFTQNDGERHQWVIEFTATTTAATLALHPNAPVELGSFGSVVWTLDQYVVEEILPTDEVPPTPGRLQARTMYEVKAIQGPTVSAVRRAPCGVMAQVTYAIRAGQPFKYREPIFAGGLPAGTSQQVADIPCSEDGLAQVINFSYDPSLEAAEVVPNTWLGGGSNLTFDGRVSSPTARLGGFVYRITADAAGTLSGINHYYLPSATDGGPVPVGGDILTVSGYFRAITAGTLGLFTFNVFVTMDGFPSISQQMQVDVTQVGTWYRGEVQVTIPGNVALETIEINFIPPPDVAAAVGMEADAVMIERGSVASEPFDQTSENVTWSAGVGTSALLLNPVAEDISADPDCPQPPAPPAPPSIDDACVESPAAYNRTVVSIPADTVPRNLTAYPVITLTAGSEPVRQARIRFWENPDNVLIDDIYPCNYDGEIIVSYLAAGATMVIDGVLHDATVTKPGFEPVNANHVLYGPDGGPVDWPELSGGVPYLVTLELDSGEAYADTLMTIDLVVRD